MSSSKFSDEFKRDAVAQISEQGYPGIAASVGTWKPFSRICGRIREFWNWDAAAGGMRKR
ncbi:hypothetical protein ACR03S_16875 (plasmid) [Limimaricola variabilis]